ncbi:hypothetical protein B4119_3604 [Parageobacillus caldoxylosilyticus]|uniref:Uncharacterized protein n=1 Tax=Saccharococcus caldoxylosilyticus TaxID=81408 RepID=A0A150LXS0_9BACL|nr:hypothetical protein B4119_3604 [Parageobacillus caldoxylosilyticus]
MNLLHPFGTGAWLLVAHCCIFPFFQPSRLPFPATLWQGKL